MRDFPYIDHDFFLYKCTFKKMLKLYQKPVKLLSTVFILFAKAHINNNNKLRNDAHIHS